MTMIPASWRMKLAHIYLVEVLAVIIGGGSAVFGVSLITVPHLYEQLASFRQAFALLPPQWWGVVMVVLAVSMLALLIHSRAAAAIPLFLLAIVWVAWTVPIILSPGYAPSAPIVYWMITLFTLVTGGACMVRREEIRAAP